MELRRYLKLARWLDADRFLEVYNIEVYIKRNRAEISPLEYMLDLISEGAIFIFKGRETCGEVLCGTVMLPMIASRQLVHKPKSYKIVDLM